jgi:hypothetical protein
MAIFVIYFSNQNLIHKNIQHITERGCGVEQKYCIAGKPAHKSRRNFFELIMSREGKGRERLLIGFCSAYVISL